MCEIKKEGNRAATQLPCRGTDKILANKYSIPVYC